MKINTIFIALGGSRNERASIRTGIASVQNSTREKLLGTESDNKLIFEHYVAGLCRKTINKMYSLSLIAPVMDHDKLR